MGDRRVAIVRMVARALLRRAASALAVGVVASASLLPLGCGGPTVFAGQSQFAIEGPPPPPPPAPPPPPRVLLKEDRIEITEKIQFDFDTATINLVSFGLLDEVAKVIRDHPEIRRLSIEGHASAEGADAYNLDLSDRRARAVMDYIVGKGQIEASRITARGFGETMPIASNDHEQGREMNRRVEFNIIERDEARAKPPEAPPKP